MSNPDRQGTAQLCELEVFFVFSKTISLDFCFIITAHELMGKNGLIKRENSGAQLGARTHDPEIKSVDLN